MSITARLEYKIVLNGDEWILDPANPHQVMSGFGTNSELRMPLYAVTDESASRDDLLFIQTIEGHSWATWRAMLDEMLYFFFGIRLAT